MKVNLLTDAPKHNLALMKISTYHKERGDTVTLNEPQTLCDTSYGSWLFSRRYYAHINGGPAHLPATRLPSRFQNCLPDYTLYPRIDFSLGFTWESCPRSCAFCVVPKQEVPRVHQSIWDFHDERFQKICLLNNNTFTDPQWRETFEEIWDAGLEVVDQNGYDLRLLDEEKAEALKRTKFEKTVHFAWDLMGDEKVIIRGLEIARRYKIEAMVYVLIGFNTTREEDLYRCQVVHNYHLDSYPMPYNGGTKADRAFKRFICLRGYRQYGSLSEAWVQYGRSIPRKSLRPQSA